MSALLTLGIVVVCAVAWLACGVPAGRRMAPVAYQSRRNSYYCRNDAQDGRMRAVLAYVGCLILGPLSLLIALADLTTVRTVPALTEAEAKAKREELSRLQQQIDQAHRDLGIKPFGGAA